MPIKIKTTPMANKLMLGPVLAIISALSRDGR
jgi:hypothetical protein